MSSSEFRTLVVIGLLCLLAACSKVTADNYNKLKTGMTYREVQELLGTPTRCSDVMAIRNCTWGDERRYINVSFAGDKVVLFASENLR